MNDLKQKASVDAVLTRSQQIDERPLDPTRDAEDMMGDSSGKTGMTTGDPRQISAEPNEMPEDTSGLPGGVIADPTQTNPTGFTEEQLSEEKYNSNMEDGESSVRVKADEDMASEDELATDSVVPELADDSDDSSDDTESEDAAVAASGEEEASGSAASPDSDDDVGLMMKRVTGKDPDPHMDNPQELGAAEDVDQAEEDIRTS